MARAGGGGGVATVAASDLLCGPIEAAMANGMLAHSDETDDSHAPSHSHPGCSVVPAALAAGEQFGIDGSRLLRARQVHGASVLAHRAGQSIGEPTDADILVTSDPEVVAAIQTADCVPVLIADTRTGAIAAAHAGWRGLAQRVPLATVGAMVNEFGTRETKLIAAIGPSISACCYEVGGEVRDRFAAAGFDEWELSRWFSRDVRSSPNNPSMSGGNPRAPEGHWFLDLWAAARDQLRAAGVREDRIFVAELCTASHPEALCSYRRDGSSAGRMAAAIRTLKP